MTFTVNDFEDLIRILEAQPEWRQRLRRALFPELDVARALQELAESQHQTNLALQRLEVRFEELAIGQDAIRYDVSVLKEDVSVLKEDVSVLKEDVSVLKEDMIVVKGDVSGLKEDMVVVKGDVSGLKEDMVVVRGDVSGLKEDNISIKRDVAQLKGDSFERIYHLKADAIFGRYLYNGHNATNLVADRLQEALEQGRISETDFDQVLATDLLLGGRSRQTQEELVLVVEASWLAEVNDVERASSQAAILRKIGLHALPIVAGREWSAEAADLAQSRKVIVTSNGRIDADSWQQALESE